MKQTNEKSLKLEEISELLAISKTKQKKIFKIQK